MYTHIERANCPILELDDGHPAKRFLSAFMECRMNCSERELEIGGQTPIDQAWQSAIDGRVWTFSGFIYTIICFDIVLDGFPENSPYLTESEVCAADQLPKLRLMMEECAAAARQCSNDEIIEMTHQVQEMLNLWEEHLNFRKETIARARD
jgi:hypothetical protein